MATINFDPPPTLKRFMQSDKFIRVVRGPVGSGKSYCMVMELLRRAAEQTPDPADGKRRTRFAIVRNTLPQLKTTCLKTINEALRGIAVFHVSDGTVTIKLGDIESEWIFLPLDSPDNVQRLLSLDLTGAWLSEVRELPVRILLDVFSRCGRYPSQAHGGWKWKGVIAETNSFTEDSDWNKVLEERELDGKPTPETWDYFVQPGAREPNAENRENIGPNYYEDLIETNSPEWVEQYVDNIIAPSLSGEAVFRHSFRSTFHIAKDILQPVPSTMLLAGFDYGRNPAVVLTQLDPKGRLLVLDEVYTSNMGVEQFIQTMLRPVLSQPKYARLPIGICGDPSGTARGQIGEESVYGMLKRLGLSAQPAPTNDVAPRLRSVEKWLLQQREGAGAILFSPTCTSLIRAMQSKYRYAKKKDGELQPKPDKSHPWSDIADALQYAVLGHSTSVTARLVRRTTDSARVRQVSSAGWT
jgi:hypothetical protein